MIYYDPNLESDQARVGMTEYVFVRPGWRRRGVARYLSERDIAYAILAVLA